MLIAALAQRKCCKNSEIRREQELRAQFERGILKLSIGYGVLLHELLSLASQIV